jgi:DNA-binding transcriptional regulator YiaG
MSFNSLIANTHRAQRKLNGVTVSLGAMVSVALSSILTVLGVVSVLYTNDRNLFVGAMKYVMTPVAVLIAGICAFLIERLTLVSCAKVRLGREQVREKEKAFAEMSLVSEPTERIKKHHEKEIKDIKASYRPSYLGIIFGASLSVIMESFFVHFIFVGWNTPILFFTTGDIASVMLSGLVSFTLISSEISKKQDHAVIEEALTSDGFMQIAAEADVKDETNRHLLINSGPKVGKILEGEILDIALDESVTKMIAQNLGSKDITKKISEHREAKTLQLAQESERTKAQLTLLMGGKAKRVEPVESEVIEATVEEESTPAPRVVQKSASDRSLLQYTERRQSRFEECKEELIILLQTRPNVTRQEVAERFQVSKSTVQNWITKVKTM